jgi:hypothetical protein
MNLRLKIILPIISAALLILSAGNIIIYNHTSENLQKIIRENMHSKAFFLSRAIHVFAENAVINISTIASSEIIENFFSSRAFDKDTIEATCKILDTIVSAYPNFDRISLLNLQGVTLASSTRSAIGQSFADRSYVVKALAGSANFSEPLLSRISGNAISHGTPCGKLDKSHGGELLLEAEFA